MIRLSYYYNRVTEVQRKYKYMDTSGTIHETSKFIDGVKFLPWYEYYLSVSLYNRLNNPAINAILKVYGICFLWTMIRKKFIRYFYT